MRDMHFGEGGYDESEKVIQKLLAEAGNANVSKKLVSVNTSGAELAMNEDDLKSPETYLGFFRAENFVSPGGFVQGKESAYVAAPETLKLNEWSLTGRWTVNPQESTLIAADGRIAYRFHARDLHLVLGPATDGKPIRFRIAIDGKPPGDNHGVDTDAAGNGTVEGQRLYQLIRQKGPVTERTFTIEFFDPGVQAYAFTFG